MGKDATLNEVKGDKPKTVCNQALGGCDSTKPRDPETMTPDEAATEIAKLSQRMLLLAARAGLYVSIEIKPKVITT